MHLAWMPASVWSDLQIMLEISYRSPTDPTLIRPNADCPDELQTLSPTELREKITDLQLLLDADEEYIKTLERRNEKLWGMVQKSERRLHESGIHFRPFDNYY